MTKPRKNAPALYELIGGRSRLSPPGPGSPQARPEEEPEPYEEEAFEEEQARSILGPGRTVRMPVGYFFFGLAIIIGIGIVAYMLGYKMRDRAYERQERREAQAQVPSEPLDDMPVNESLLAGGGSGASRPADARASDAGTGTPSGEIGRGEYGRVIVVEGGVADPRVKGSNYAIVASLGKDRAMDLASFLADQGVDVAVVRLNNARLHSVVALRGFPRGTFGSDERNQFDAALRRLGQEYAAQGGGRKSFADLYWDKH